VWAFLKYDVVNRFSEAKAKSLKFTKILDGETPRLQILVRHTQSKEKCKFLSVPSPVSPSPGSA